MAKPVEQQKAEWIENTLKSNQCYFDKCDKCGSVRHGCYSVIDRTFKCVVCLADEIFYTPDPAEFKKPFPVAELKYGGLVPLDVEDFAKV